MIISMLCSDPTNTGNSNRRNDNNSGRCVLILHGQWKWSIYIYWSPWYQMKVVRMITMIIDNDWATVEKWISQEILLRGKGSIISRAGFKSTSWLLKFCTTHHIMYVLSCSPRRFYIQQQKRPRRQFQYGRRGRRFIDPSKIRFQQSDEQRHKMTFASWFCQTFVFSCQVLSEENKKANPSLFFHFLRPNEVLNFVWKSNENESFDLLGLSWTKMVKDAIFFISFSFEIFHSWKHSF